MKKYQIFFFENLHFLLVKFSVHLNRRVFVMAVQLLSMLLNPMLSMLGNKSADDILKYVFFLISSPPTSTKKQQHKSEKKNKKKKKNNMKQFLVFHANCFHWKQFE